MTFVAKIVVTGARISGGCVSLLGGQLNGKGEVIIYIYKENSGANRPLDSAVAGRQQVVCVLLGFIVQFVCLFF